VVAAVFSIALAVIWIATLPSNLTYGWDESMHVALPAERMRIALAEGEFGLAFEALLSCAQYPFVEPVLLACVQSVFGASEQVARAFGIVEWCATIFGVFVLTRLVIESLPADRRPRAAFVAPWLAFAFAALSPLALGFAGTLFLEIPSACASVWALVAWIALWREPTRKRALVAGTLVTVALFTKWNYGILLGAGLFVDLVLRLLQREGHLERVRVILPLAAVPVAASLWWFLIPLPGGFDVAAEHRSAFASFLTGNQDLARAPASLRAFFATCLLALSPRMAVLLAAGLVTALFGWRNAALRTLIVALLATSVPVWIHPFFLERFFVPGAVTIWILAAVGITRWLNGKQPRTSIALAIIALLSIVPLPDLYPHTGHPHWIPDTVIVGEKMGVIRGGEYERAYQVGVLEERTRLLGSRALPSGGIDRVAATALLDAVAREIGPTERIGWIGVSSELSPAAIHLGLLARGGSRERFLRDAETKIDLDYFDDPHVDVAGVHAFAEEFDVVFATDPPDLKGRRSREWANVAREMLLQDGSWVSRELGRFEIARPLREPLVVTLFACRRKK